MWFERRKEEEGGEKKREQKNCPPYFALLFIFLPRFVEIFMASSMICLKCLRQLNSPKEDHSRSEGDTSSWVSFFFYL